MHIDEYLKLAAVEDRMWYFRALHRHIGRELSRMLATRDETADPGPPCVLDAGCGTGGLILALRADLPRVAWTGLDFSPLACDLARRRTAGEIVTGSVDALPFSEATFDAIVSADVICQIDDGARALREFHRVLRPGGATVINVPALPWLWSYHDDTCQTKHRFRRDELHGMLVDAGFEPVYVTYRNFVVFPIIAARRKLMPRQAGGSDVRLYPRPVEAAFHAMMACEHVWMARRWRLPIGTSVFAVAIRR